MSSQSTVLFYELSQVFASLSVVVGLLLGQIVFGVLGDFVGRRRSFLGSTVTALFQFYIYNAVCMLWCGMVWYVWSIALNRLNLRSCR